MATNLNDIASLTNGINNLVTSTTHPMSASNFSIVGAFSAIGTFLIAALAIWGDWFRARLAPAKLVIELHNIEGDLTHYADQHGRPAPPPNLVYFYHLKVVNKRHWISPKNCCVLLKAMNKRGPDGNFHPLKMSVPLQFVWSPAEISNRLVPLQKDHVLDFGRVAEGDPKFVPVFYSTSNNFQGFVGPNEVVRYSLEIISDGYVSQKTQVFEVAFDGVWSSDPLQMQAHLRIREIV